MAQRVSRFVWYELLTTDDVASARFYRAVIGWNEADAGFGDRRYTLMKAGEVPVAGIMAMPPDLAARDVPPHWVGYVSVAHLDDMLAAVRSAGGAVHWGPEEIPGVGVLATVADPQGAVFSLLQPAAGSQGPPPAPAGTPGHTGWHELHAVDGAAVFDFYGTLFGWTKAHAHDMGEHGVYQTFDIGEAWSGGIMTKSAKEPKAHWLYYFNVDEAGAAADRIRAARGTVIMGSTPVPGRGYVALGMDPQGGHFAVVSRAP
jgi:predicted enzyme related to lactoylglutathione lyase